MPRKKSRITDNIAEQTEKIMSKIKQHKKTKNTLNVLNNTRADDLGSFSDDDIRFTVETSLTLERVDSLKDKIAILASEIEYEDIILRERLDKMRFKLSDNARQTEPEEADSFKISNPYEILFGFLYLLDSGDSLPWIPHVFGNVCGYAVQQLPWNSRNNTAYWDLIDERMEEHYSNSDKDDDSVSVRKYDRTAEDDSEQYADLYEMKYTDAFMWVRENMKFQKDELISFNLPQMIYEASSVCMPRYRANMYEDVQAFVKSGMSRKQAELMRYFKSFAEFSTNKHGFADVIKTENLIRERSGNAVNQSTSELRQILSARNDEIESLKKKLYEAEKQASDLNKKIDKMRDDSAAENQELLELRDLIYKIQNSTEEEELKQESGVSFPYRTKQRVVVFGGHATWLKVIVKLLPNVKFIDPYADPDVNTIRNADVVWMQTNAMPHNKYNKIMEIVRMKKIPVKYFAYASAEKCALQLAEYDTSR